MWRLTSAWWKATWTSWYKIRWELTWHDLPPAECASYGLYQPIWFHSDAMLHYEQLPRTTTRTAHRRCIGMVVEPQRSFRLHVSRVFGVRSLADFMRVGGVWPSQEDFVQRHIDFTLGSVLPGRPAQWLRVLFKEATQIVERLGATRLVLHPDSSRRHLLPYFGCSSGDKVYLIPLIPRSALLRVVWTPKLPKKQHPMTIHSQRVGEERIQAYVKYNKHLQKILLPVFADLHFTLRSSASPLTVLVLGGIQPTHSHLRSCWVRRDRDGAALVLRVHARSPALRTRPPAHGSFLSRSSNVVEYCVIGEAESSGCVDKQCGGGVRRLAHTSSSDAPLPPDGPQPVYL